MPPKRSTVDEVSDSKATKPFVLRLPTELHLCLKLLATVEGSSVNSLVVDAMKAFWAQHPKRPQVERLAKERRTPPVPKAKRGAR